MSKSLGPSDNTKKPAASKKPKGTQEDAGSESAPAAKGKRPKKEKTYIKDMVRNGVVSVATYQS